MGGQKDNGEKPDIRRIMIVCAKCRNTDIDDNSLLEIDFRHSVLINICRKCGYENRASLSPPQSNFPSIGVGTKR
jgi:hypothetical protein